MPTQDCHRGTKHLGWKGIWIGAGHPGGVTWRGGLCDAPGRDENTDGAVPPQLPGVQRDMFEGAPI